jgi:hypothetical protein
MDRSWIGHKQNNIKSQIPFSRKVEKMAWNNIYSTLDFSTKNK